MYWGIYQTQERTEANFAASYLGGEDTDYDVVKVNTEDWDYVIEATDGNLDAWQIYITLLLPVLKPIRLILAWREKMKQELKLMELPS